MSCGLAFVGRTLQPSTDHHNDLQSLPPLVAARCLAGIVCGPGRGDARRNSGFQQHHCQDTAGVGRRKVRRKAKSSGAPERARNQDPCRRRPPWAVDRFHFTAAQVSDNQPAPELLLVLPPADMLFSNASYDSDRLRVLLIERGTLPVIPNSAPESASTDSSNSPASNRTLSNRCSVGLRTGGTLPPDTTGSRPNLPQR